MQRTITIILIAVSLLFSFQNARAFLRGTTGTLEGKIVDQKTTEPLLSVNIILDGTVYGAVSDSTGHYRISNVRVGVYDLKLSLVGYKTLFIRNVTVLSDLVTKINAELEQTTIELDVVETHADRPLIQKDQPMTAYFIGEQKIEQLPLSNVQDLLVLQPGTTLEGNVRGGKTGEVVYLLDGLPVQDVIGGESGLNLPKSSITGLTIYTGGFEPEYGNAQSGVVNMITRTGTDIHKVNVKLERDSWLPPSMMKQTDKATDAEVTLSGPIVARQLYYFSSNNIILSDTRWWQDFENFYSSPVNKEFNSVNKAEYVPSPTLRLSLQAVISLKRWHDYEYSWRYNLSGLPSRSRDAYRLAAILTHTLSEKTYYSLSLSRYYHKSLIGDAAPDASSLQPYQYDFFLRYIVQGTRNWRADAQQTIYTFKGDVTSRVEQEHLIKAGFEFNLYHVSSDLIKYEPQLTYFGKPLINAPLLNYSSQYSYYPKSGSFYVQDKMTLDKAGTILNIGVRWDFLDPTAERPVIEFIPVSGNEYNQKIKGFTKAAFKHQFSPRFALAAPVGEKSFFFLNFGHYFQFPLFDYLYSGINPIQLKQGTKNVLTGDPDLKPERTVLIEGGFKQELTQDVLASITFFKKNFTNQIDAKTLIPFDSKSAGDYGFASYVNNAEASSKGFEIIVAREHNEKLSGSISYTYMEAEGVSEYVNQTINREQWGFPLYPKPYALSWDQRHTVKIEAEAQLPFGIRGDAVIHYNSPKPYSFYPTRDGFTPSDTTRAFVPNNARMENVVIVNLKLSKQFQLGSEKNMLLTVYADGRNILNTKNIRWIDSNGRVGGELSDPGAYYDPRRVSIGVRCEF